MRQNQQLLFNAFLMLVSPLFVLIQTLRGKKSKFYVKWSITIFATFYASTFNRITIGDGFRHWQNVYDYYVGLSFAKFLSDFWDIITFTSNSDVNEDVFIHFLSYFVGGFLNAPGLFFVFVGFIYGYFFSSSMVKIFDFFPHWKKHTGIFILAIYFIAILNLQSMNTVRTWTGFWVLFYGTIQYLDTKQPKYLLLIFSAPLFHIGFFAMALPTWVVLFLPLKKIWIIALYALSFSISIINPQTAVDNLNQTEVGREKVKGYYIGDKTGGEEAENVTEVEVEEKRWYRRYYQSPITRWAIVSLTLILLLNGDYLRRMNILEGKLFSIGLISKVLSNSSWFLFALSNRSNVISNLFILAALLIFWQRNFKHKGTGISIKNYMKPLWFLCIVSIIPVFVFYLSNTLEYTSLYVLITPFTAWVDDSLRVSIRGLLGYLFGF